MSDYPFAPEFDGITSWFNTAPLSMEGLRGKVLGIQFWSHSCQNCRNALPQMSRMADRFIPKGFAYISVHSPELPTDADLASVRRFVLSSHFTYPVAADQDLVMWNAYHNQYWPTLYLVDKRGRIREGHIGEGGYHRIEHDIRHLLEE